MANNLARSKMSTFLVQTRCLYTLSCDTKSPHIPFNWPTTAHWLSGYGQIIKYIPVSHARCCARLKLGHVIAAKSKSEVICSAQSERQTPASVSPVRTSINTTMTSPKATVTYKKKASSQSAMTRNTSSGRHRRLRARRPP